MRCLTLRKYADLMAFAYLPVHQGLTPQTNEAAPVDLITVPKLLKWIKETTYYKTEATRSQYVHDFNLKDLLDDNFFTNLQKHPYIKTILSVLRVFIHQHRLEAQYPLDVGRLYKKLQGALEQARDEEDHFANRRRQLSSHGSSHTSSLSNAKPACWHLAECRCSQSSPSGSGN
mmetsp:Transcript_6969/g.22008  ORF Transcript_6969/g.22008 Transcript_6969/m.22008 type:complete len:174 (+) Transcript_6969:160-681(+)